MGAVREVIRRHSAARAWLSFPLLRPLARRYLHADLEDDEEHRWVVEAFAESELPHPWISYVGIGLVWAFRRGNDFLDEMEDGDLLPERIRD